LKTLCFGWIDSQVKRVDENSYAQRFSPLKQNSKYSQANKKRGRQHVAHSALPEKPEMLQLVEQAGFVEISIRDEPGCYLCIAHKPKKT
jgi:hypothetical protein